MPCLFLPRKELASDEIIIHGENARYLSVVLRVRPGDLLTIFDGHGTRYTCNILEIRKKEVRVQKIGEEPYSAESPISIILAQGIPKGEKMDFIVQKSVELGVRKIIPLITERSQVRHTDKTERWNKIALSASQQCGRGEIPQIEMPLSFDEFLSRKEGERGIIFSEEKEDRNLHKVLNNFKNFKDIALLVGPEGGFSKNETSLAIQKGFIEASLGPRILRTETAPIVAIGIIQYELGDMG